MIATSDRKWKPNCFVRFQRVSVLSNGTLLHSELARVELHHQEQGKVVEAGRDRCHQDHVEIRDLEELGNEECRRAQHRRRNDRPQPPRREQPARGVLAVARLGEHGVSDGAERDGGRDTAARRPAQQERRQHDGAPRAGGLAAHRGEGEVDEEFARAGELQERAVNGEQDDERGGDVHRHAEDPLQRHVHVADEPRDVVAAVRPRLAQVRAEHRVGDKQHADERHDPARAAARRLQHQQRQDHAEHHVQVGRDGAAVGEIVAADETVADDEERQRHRDPVPPHDAVAEAAGEREQQEHQEQDEADVDHAQLLRRHDRVRGIQVEQRHHDGDRHHDAPEQAGEAVGRAFFRLDVLLGFLERRLVDRDVVLRGDLVNQPVFFVAHRARLLPAAIALPGNKKSSAWGALDFGLARDNPTGYLTFNPCSRKYLTAPGWNGITIAALVWCFKSKFSDSLCTRTMSSFLSNMVFTML